MRTLAHLQVRKISEGEALVHDILPFREEASRRLVEFRHQMSGRTTHHLCLLVTSADVRKRKGSKKR